MDDTPTPRFRICDLSLALKLGVTGLIFVLAGGLVASMAHLKLHHQNRDEQPGVSMNDIRGAYRGVEIRAPLLVALEQGHPNTLSASDRQVLIDWLNAGRVSIDYDNLDLGDSAPAEIIARDCVSCHSEKSADPVASKTPLDTFESVKKLAFTKKLDPPPTRILVLSTHAHALSMATMSLVIAALLVCTRLPRFVTHGVTMLVGVSLAADIAAWWLAREDLSLRLLGYSLDIPTAGFVYLIVGAGTVYNALTALSLILILLDLWWPRRRRA